MPHQWVNGNHIDYENFKIPQGNLIIMLKKIEICNKGLRFIESLYSSQKVNVTFNKVQGGIPQGYIFSALSFKNGDDTMDQEDWIQEDQINWLRGTEYYCGEGDTGPWSM